MMLSINHSFFQIIQLLILFFTYLVFILLSVLLSITLFKQISILYCIHLLIILSFYLTFHLTIYLNYYFSQVMEQHEHPLLDLASFGTRYSPKSHNILSAKLPLMSSAICIIQECMFVYTEILFKEINSYALEKHIKLNNVESKSKIS